MWDNPRLLNLAASGLTAIALAIALFVTGSALMHSPAFPLKTIRVLGDLKHVKRSDVATALQGRLSGTFFSVDLGAIRALFEGIPWVRKAEVRRMWPDGLDVTLEEHVALARWGRERDGRLVNTYGELFSGRAEAPLPLFAGPAGSEADVARRYAEFSKLLAPLGLEPRAVLLSDRYAWQLRLSNGLNVQLGRERERDPVTERLARFISVYPRTVGKLARLPDYADLRYPNGFALPLPESRTASTHRLPRT